MRKEYPLTQEKFDQIYSKVPRLTVELIVRSKDGIVLTKRTIEPCKGKWHLPGGTVYYGELLAEAVKRIAKKELDIEVIDMKQAGVIEYPDHIASGYGDPRGIAFVIDRFKGRIEIDSEADTFSWFDVLPADMHANQDAFLLGNGFIKVS